MRKTFLDWVATRKAGDNPRGDLIRDTRATTKRPSRDEWECTCYFLRLQGACPEAIEAAERLWVEYQHWKAYEEADAWLRRRGLGRYGDAIADF
jgi:hypothetical protein